MQGNFIRNLYPGAAVPVIGGRAAVLNLFVCLSFSHCFPKLAIRQVPECVPALFLCLPHTRNTFFSAITNTSAAASRSSAYVPVKPLKAGSIATASPK